MLERLGCLVLAASVVTASGIAQAATGPETAPSGGSPASPEAVRTQQQVAADIDAVIEALRQTGFTSKDVYDISKHQAMQEKYVPLIHKYIALLKEQAKQVFRTNRAEFIRVTFILPQLAYMGDADAIAEYSKRAESQFPPDADFAKTVLLTIPLIQAGRDTAQQDKAIDAIEAALRANPKMNAMATMLYNIYTTSIISGAQKSRIEALMDVSTSPVMAEFKKNIAADQKLHNLGNIPVVLKARIFKGGEFDSSTLKGKVILVDFWATWCGPCVAELPHVKAIYKKYHDQGLEVVGVSSDYNGAALEAFLKNDPEMTWVQLFDEATAGLHPLCEKFGIKSIPTVFLIDRKGVLRSIEGRKYMDEMIPKLLAEKAE